jgi:hypothetical protein
MAETRGEVTEISACRVGTQMLATPIIDSVGRLKVIVWEVIPHGYHVRRLSPSHNCILLSRRTRFIFLMSQEGEERFMLRKFHVDSHEMSKL